MRKLGVIVSVVFLFLALRAMSQPRTFDSVLVKSASDVLVGAERASLYLPYLEGKRVALVVNQTSEVFGTHLVDFLRSKNVNVVKVFAPEHGFRGHADAGERITDGLDPATQIPIKSLYGKNKKPSATDLANVDVVIFDIQDVGVRFYTYISTMHYVMQACAENNKMLVVLDRPNPNGFYVDGPVLDLQQQSFVGMHAVPLVHGMTIGEYAQMINQEGWLGSDLHCNLRVVLLSGWNHQHLYQLPVKPSPNLPNMTSVYLYPFLGLLEGTNVSAGRGTPTPFQIFGSPDITESNFSFTPQSVPGAKYPKYKGEKCYGMDLTQWAIDSFYVAPQLDLTYVLWAYAHTQNKDAFFLKNHFYARLAGTPELAEQIIQQKTPAQIRATWVEALTQFKRMRAKYLLYPDFE